MKKLFHIRHLKELLLGVVVLTLVLGPLEPLIAQAQGADINAPLTGGATDSRLGTDGSAGANSPNGSFNTTTGAPTSIQNPGATPQQQSTNPPSCSFSPGTWDLCITNVVYVFTVGIGSGFAYVAAYFFNLAVNLSLNGPIYALTFVSTGWTTARDLANMAFLFILIYIAFTIMLEAETSGTMSLLAGVIVIALLVNFSFFFTRVVIDAGNILSIQFYNSITAPTIQATAQSSNVAAGLGAAASVVGASNQTKDLTASIMGMLQLQNLFNTKSFESFYNNNKGTQGFLTVLVTLSFLYIAAGIMFYLITVMFVTVGVKFLMRIVVLWFLIIASPLAFVARAMPQGNKLRGYFDKWRDLLISHAFYPVAFMFIFLILTNFTNQMGACTNNGSTSSQSCLINDIFTALPAGASSESAFAAIGLAIANVAIRMGFVLAILYLGMKAADTISVMGAGFAKSAGSWVGGKYIGAMGAAGRNTFGHAGYAAGQTGFMQNWSRKDPMIGRALFNGLNRVGRSSFDIRGSVTNAGLPGKAQKDGYKGQVDARIKRREKEAEQYSDSVSKEQKDKFEKDKKEAQDKYQKELAAARATDAAAQETENQRAHKFAGDDIDPNNHREILATNIADTAKIQQDLMKAQADAAENVNLAKQKIEDLRNQKKEGTAEMDAAIAERNTHQASIKNFETLKGDADIKLKVYTEEQRKINEDIAKRAKELAVKIEATKVEAEKVIEEPISQRKGFGVALGSADTNFSRWGMWVPAADKKAAGKIHKGKNKGEKLLDGMKEFVKHEEGELKEEIKSETHKEAPKAAPAGGGGSHAPGH